MGEPINKGFQTGQQVREGEDFTIIIAKTGDGYKSGNKIAGGQHFKLPKTG
jgi:hypothetical protein